MKSGGRYLRKRIRRKTFRIFPYIIIVALLFLLFREDTITISNKVNSNIKSMLLPVDTGREITILNNEEYLPYMLSSFALKYKGNSLVLLDASHHRYTRTHISLVFFILQHELYHATLYIIKPNLIQGSVQEKEADVYALERMVENNYSPCVVLDMWTQLRDRGAVKVNLDTHPSFDWRIETSLKYCRIHLSL